MCVGGVSKGLGKVLAINLSSIGYDIIGTYNTDLDGVLKLGNIDYYKLDLNSTESTNKFISDIKSKYDHIDLLINNAALSLDNEFVSKTKDEFMKVLEANLVGPFLLIQGLYSIMENGVIINIASTDGIDTYSSINMDYSASKAGLINLTKSLSLVLDKTRIYAICPNWMNTETIQSMNQDYLRSEMKRINQKELIDPIVIFNKVIELINSNEKSGSIIVVEDNNE